MLTSPSLAPTVLLLPTARLVPLVLRDLLLLVAHLLPLPPLLVGLLRLLERLDTSSLLLPNRVDLLVPRLLRLV
jgi:hypothetical protein